MSKDSLKFYTFQEVAQILRCTRQTIYNMHGRGLLNATKCGKQYLVSEEDLQKFIKTGKC